MIIYYSGTGSKSDPEIVLAGEANLMLTYHHFHKDNEPTPRFDRILLARKLRRSIVPSVDMLQQKDEGADESKS